MVVDDNAALAGFITLAKQRNERQAQEIAGQFDTRTVTGFDGTRIVTTPTEGGSQMAMPALGHVTASVGDEVLVVRHGPSWVVIGNLTRAAAFSGGGSGGGEFDAEAVRDAIAAALVAGSNITITPDDGGDTITIAATGGAVTSVNGQTGAAVLDADDIDDTSTTNKWATAAELSKLAGIETAADVTDAANVGAAINGASTFTPGAGDYIAMLDGSTLGRYGYTALLADLATLFAALSHSHAASAITSGTLAAARLGSGTPDANVWLRGDGAWAADPGPSAILHPVGFQAANLTTVTAFPSGTCGIQYLGKASKAATTCTLRCRVTTGVATITWAEVAIMKGTHPGPGANASLTPCGFTNVAATFNSTGQKSTTIALTGVNAGDDLWAVWGSSATTPFQLRGGLADDLQTGSFQSMAVRPSLATTPQATVLVNATTAPAWLAVVI